MRRSFITYLFLLVIYSYHSFLFAPPTAILWTNTTTDIQPFGQMNFELDTFFSVFNDPGKGEQLPIDVGLTAGIFKCGPWNAEFGFDYLGGTDYPLFFNAKVGIPEEDAYFKGMPTFNLGIFNVGTQPGKTDQNVFDVIIGKKIPGTTLRLFVGGYYGNPSLGHDRAGFSLAFDWNFFPAKDCHGEKYHKLVFLGDYASGKNAIGGGALGISYFFTPKISVSTGPAFFNDASINGKWKWTVQFNCYIQLWECCKKKGDKD